MSVKHNVNRRGNIRNIYDELSEFLEKGRNKQKRVWANNTVISRQSYKNEIIVTYHSTDIVKVTPDKITLNSGGWRTSTTKDRIDWFLPAGIYIYQEKGIWYISDGMWNNPNRIVLVFTDGIEIPNCFSDPKQRKKSEQENKRIRELNLKINKYCNKLGNMIMKRELSEPSGGDCWFCLFRDSKTGKVFGDNDPEHLLSHLKQMYIVPSLVFNALEEYHQNAQFWGTYYRKDCTESMLRVFKDFSIRAVRTYFKKRLAIGR